MDASTPQMFTDHYYFPMPNVTWVRDSPCMPGYDCTASKWIISYAATYCHWDIPFDDRKGTVTKQLHNYKGVESA